VFGFSFECADSKPISKSCLAVAVRIVYAIFCTTFHFAPHLLLSKTQYVFITLTEKVRFNPFFLSAYFFCFKITSGVSMPSSVMTASTYSRGVMSKAGFNTLTPSGAILSERTFVTSFGLLSSITASSEV